jgi:hypothetical protein
MPIHPRIPPCRLTTQWLSSSKHCRTLPYRRAKVPQTRSIPARPLSSSAIIAASQPTTNGIPWGFICQLAIGLPAALWFYKVISASLKIGCRAQRDLPTVSHAIRLPTENNLHALCPTWRSGREDRARDSRRWPRLGTSRDDYLGRREPHRLARRQTRQNDGPASSLESWRRDCLPSGHAFLGRQIFIETNAETRRSGNASTPLRRLPIFKRILESRSLASLPVAVLAVAPRSYWSSTHRLFAGPSERRLLLDFSTALSYAHRRQVSSLLAPRLFVFFAWQLTRLLPPKKVSGCSVHTSRALARRLHCRVPDVIF